MEMEIAAAHGKSSGPAPDPSLGDPIAIGRRVAIFHEPVRQPQDLAPDLGMIAIRRMNADTGQRGFGKLAREKIIPGEAGGPAPAASHTVSQGAGPIILAGPQIAQAG